MAFSHVSFIERVVSSREFANSSDKLFIADNNAHGGVHRMSPRCQNKPFLGEIKKGLMVL